jgi:hypothetical protein
LVPSYFSTLHSTFNSTIFGKKNSLNIKRVFWFSLQLHLKQFSQKTNS